LNRGIKQTHKTVSLFQKMFTPAFLFAWTLYLLLCVAFYFSNRCYGYYYSLICFFKRETTQPWKPKTALDHRNKNYSKCTPKSRQLIDKRRAMRFTTNLTIACLLAACFCLRNVLIQTLSEGPKSLFLRDDLWWIDSYHEQKPNRPRVLYDQHLLNHPTMASSPHRRPPAPKPHILDDQDAHTFMTSGCYVVEDICFSSSTQRHRGSNRKRRSSTIQRRSFYKTSLLNNDDNSHGHYPTTTTTKMTAGTNNTRRQPKIVLEFPNFAEGFPRKWEVAGAKNRTSSRSSSSFVGRNCQTSPVQNHIVLHGKYPKMVMEFYLRVVAGLYQIVLQLPWWSKQPQSPDVQLYLGIPEFSSSHSIFLAPFTKNPIKLFQDVWGGDASTVTATDVSSSSSSSTSSSCMCLPRLVLCGYSHRDIKGQSIQQRQRIGSNTRMPLSEPTGNLYNLRPIGHVAMAMGKTPPFPQFWQDLRTIMRRTMVDQNPWVVQQITQLKQVMTIGSLVVDSYEGDDAIRTVQPQPPPQSLYTADLDHNTLTIASPMNATHRNKASSTSEEQQLLKNEDWKLVGFSQRGSRRRWLNLPGIIQQCNDRWNNTQYKIVCIEVNMDNSESKRDPLYQVVLHGGLSAMIGIHGSQQAHAVWLPPQAHQLELLPYLQPGHGQFGIWTQDTHTPTMNGWIVQDTDINHMGYPLDYHSVPQNCTMDSKSQHHQHTDGAINCNNSTRWDNRDFVVDWSIVEVYVTTYLLPGPSAPQTCDEFEATARDKFVLYNIHCSNVSSTKANRNRVMTTNNKDNNDSRTMSARPQEGASDQRYIASTNTGTSTDSPAGWVYRHFYRPRKSFLHLRRQQEKFPNETLYALVR
jgi:hypothetical protein